MNYAIYRLPYQQTCTWLIQNHGKPAVLPSYDALRGQRGFVFAPFDITEECPLLLMQPDTVETMMPEQLPDTIGDLSLRQYQPVHFAEDERERYHVDFCNFHANLANGQFRKLVLARSLFIPAHGDINPVALFREACASYPRMFIALVSMSACGTWLMATPEILLESIDDKQWRTIALAGTMTIPQDGWPSDSNGTTINGISKTENLTSNGTRKGGLLWSEKNIREQRLVASYLMEQLEQFSTAIREEGPRTVRAANLVHLRSDFCFTLDQSRDMGRLIGTIHPTPAVCGLPKAEAHDFILKNESMPRRYYSGFCGPVNIKAETHLFVSLRCMEICNNSYVLHAGGGLMPESEEQQEWLETEAKMETMRRLLK